MVSFPNFSIGLDYLSAVSILSLHETTLLESCNFQLKEWLLVGRDDVPYTRLWELSSLTNYLGECLASLVKKESKPKL